MHRVLLVNEEVEVEVVQALELALHRHRARWRVEVATSAAAAVARFEEQPFDAIITSVRMSGTSGLTLLERVVARWPATVRVVLTGAVDGLLDERLRALAHHVVLKPVSATALHERLALSLDARDRLEGALRDSVGALGPLPALPATWEAIDRLSRQPDASIEDFARAAERDPAVSSNVLRVVNSAWFGLSRAVTSLREAVRLLGIKPLESIVLATEVFGRPDATTTQLQRRAVARLAIAPGLVRALRVPGLLDEVCTAAVLADVGELVELLLRERGAVANVDHALLGAVLLTLWGLPPVLCEAVALHHRPRTLDDASPTLPALVALLCRLQEWAELPPAARLTLEPQLDVLAQVFGVTREVLDGFGTKLAA